MTSTDRTAITPPGGRPPRIAVKLTPQARQGVLAGTTTVAAILDRAVPGVARDTGVQPLFTGIPQDRIDVLVQRAQRNDPGYRPPQFDAWWDVLLDPDLARDAAAVDELVGRIQRLPEVVDAYPLRASPFRAAAAPPAAARAALIQGYLGAAGVNASAVRAEAGGRGETIGFVDLETGWNLDHEDLKDAGIKVISGDNVEFFEHGTAVLGIVMMVENSVGGVGIAPNCNGRVVSQYRPEFNTAAAILDAATQMDPGDVLLLEVQAYEPIKKTFTAPAEVELANYEQIELAVKADVVVVEAAGNGTIDLDAYADRNGRNIFRRSVRDSGAVWVGGADPAPLHARTGASNFGSRIDCFGWDAGIETATTDAAGTDDTAYTDDFGRTSGASAMVAGAALVVQAMAAHTTGRLKPPALRARLTVGATLSATPGTDRVGVKPNLRAIADNT